MCDSNKLVQFKIMKKSVVEIKCSCGNICIRGNPTLFASIQNDLNANEAGLFKDAEMVFIVPPNSIRVRGRAKAGTRTICDTCCEVLCTKCSCSFLFCFRKNAVFVMPRSGEQSESKKTGLIRPMSAFIPSKLTSFLRMPAKKVVQHQDNENIIGNKPGSNAFQSDEDFDLMFSRTRDAVVGSFTPQWVDLERNLFY